LVQTSYKVWFQNYIFKSRLFFTSGVGYAVAKYFSKDMAKIVMVCRDKERGEKVKSELYGLSGIEPDMILADFRSLEEVRRAAGEILASVPELTF